MLSVKRDNLEKSVLQLDEIHSCNIERKEYESHDTSKEVSKVSHALIPEDFLFKA